MRFHSSILRVAAFALTIIGTTAPSGAQTLGPNDPGTIVSDNSFGTNAWNQPGQAATSDNLYATVVPSTFPTQYLRATNFGFAVPVGAIVDGIEVFVERRSSVNTVFDARARIVKGGVVGATDKSIVGTWATVDTVVSYGGQNDLWGEVWTPADINGGGFGFVLSVDDNVDVAAVDDISIEVTYSLCGDSILGLSEECDDGNTLNGDCCSSTCQFDNAGTPCPDNTVCNGDETCDGSGGCDPGTALDCDDDNQCSQDSCDPIDGCVNDGSPIGGCRTALKSILVMKDKSPDTKDKLIWKWIKGQMTSQAEFGLPTGTTQFTLCIYTGTTAVLASAIPGDPVKWKPISTKGYKYKDKNADAEGITKVILKGGAANKSKVLVKGKGAGLDDVDLDELADPVTVQMVNDENNVCFESVFNSGDFIISGDPAKFKAKAQ